MENPVEEVGNVIRLLTQSSPSVQRETIEKYFTYDASFTHPFCRTGSYSAFGGSRVLIRVIYRWYKIMSPRIDMKIHSIAFDQRNLLLYVTLSQVFRIWVFPFYRADVTLTTVLQLTYDKSSQRYFIASQNDLYQVNQFLRFVAPFGANLLVWLWQVWATFFCLLGTLLMWPITLIEETVYPPGGRPPSARLSG